MAKKHPHYHQQLEALQLALVETQVQAIAAGRRICIVLEGRDGAGKDGLIKRLAEHLSVRMTRTVALAKPSDHEKGQWWFARYAIRLPSVGEIVIFNRSWYNRAGVEVVMGFSTPQEQEQFLRDAPEFERMLIESGVELVKLWLDIDKAEQKKRLDARRKEPLKQLKVSDIDKFAQKRWDAYSDARDEMLKRTSTAVSPWICVRADDKKTARIETLRYLVKRLSPPDIAARADEPDTKVVFPFDVDALTDGRLAR